MPEDITAEDLAALRKDAARYRYLRDHRYVARYPNSEYDFSMHIRYVVSGVWSNCADPAVLDSLIDIDIEKLQPGH